MCCDGSGYYQSEINGTCPVCGEDTVDGCAFEACGYSPVLCEECGYAPCDESC
jgi:hypothetical protein